MLFWFSIFDQNFRQDDSPIFEKFWLEKLWDSVSNTEPPRISMKSQKHQFRELVRSETLSKRNFAMKKLQVVEVCGKGVIMRGVGNNLLFMLGGTDPDEELELLYYLEMLEKLCNKVVGGAEHEVTAEKLSKSLGKFAVYVDEMFSQGLLQYDTIEELLHYAKLKPIKSVK